jgi:tryptophan halogenase
MEKKKIIIIGGGTAGASSLAFLQKKLGEICDITMIATQEIPVIGVGEATVGNINVFLEMCGLDPEKTCLGDARGSIKYAVHCKDWLRENHSYFTPIGLFAMEYHDMVSFNRPIKEYWESWCGLKLGLTGKAPFLKHKHWDTPLPKMWREYAYNIDAGLLGETLIKHGKEMGAKVIDKRVTEIKIINGDKIDYIVTEDGERVDADFFIDCSGFNRLVPKACGYKPKSWKSENPNDRAWATKIDYINKEEELPYLSCVECQTMEAGWRWQIGLRDRIGTGYVFSTDYISEEDALKEFKDSFEGDRVKDEDCQLIKFDTECYEKQAGTNWITCGLSSGFVEPLESTSIFFMHNNLIAFLSLIKQNKLPQDVQMVSIGAWDVSQLEDINYFFMWDKEKIDMYNKYTHDTFDCTVKYVGAHYAFAQNNRSKYWIDWTKKRKQYIAHGSDVMTYKQQHLFFGRPAFSLLSAGNELGAEIDGWDLSKVWITPRQEEAYKSGALKDERAILEDRTPKEYLQALRTILGRLTHRRWLNDVFCEYSYDLIDQYEWLDHVGELRDSDIKESRNYIESITTMF